MGFQVGFCYEMSVNHDMQCDIAVVHSKGSSWESFSNVKEDTSQHNITK